MLSSQLAALSHPLLPILQHPRVQLSRTNSVFLAPADTVFSIVYTLHLVGGSAQPMREEGRSLVPWDPEATYL